jgi:hypothetical protein
MVDWSTDHSFFMFMVNGKKFYVLRFFKGLNSCRVIPNQHPRNSIICGTDKNDYGPWTIDYGANKDYGLFFCGLWTMNYGLLTNKKLWTVDCRLWTIYLPLPPY